VKHASWVNRNQQPIEGVTQHAEECMAKIRRMLPASNPEPKPEDQPEREPGSDDEPESAW